MRKHLRPPLHINTVRYLKAARPKKLGSFQEDRNLLSLPFTRTHHSLEKPDRTSTDEALDHSKLFPRGSLKTSPVRQLLRPIEPAVVDSSLSTRNVTSSDSPVRRVCKLILESADCLGETISRF